ncbi:hypothetical protein [Vibrio sp. 10N.261.51.F12]|uniref:hypothetical protein n=1 Tax=Vibrio sp. 10N.261.51.F12 TaxID=3229679 RepID=UPI00354C20CC
MSYNTFRLAEHYTSIQHQIFDDRDNIGSLYEKLGDCVTEYLFLSHLVKKIESISCEQNLLAIISQLIEFELAQFQPLGLIPIHKEGPRCFNGEAVYLSNDCLVIKVSSYQFPTWQVLLTVVARTIYSDFPNTQMQTHFEFSGVTL